MHCATGYGRHSTVSMSSTWRGRSRINYYEILGIPQDATRDAIKRAYHQKAKTLHPDLSRTVVSAHAGVRIPHQVHALPGARMANVLWRHRVPCPILRRILRFLRMSAVPQNTTGDFLLVKEAYETLHDLEMRLDFDRKKAVRPKSHVISYPAPRGAGATRSVP